MILRYNHLKGHPVAFLKLTGLEVATFDNLLTAIQPCYLEAERQRRNRPDRQRAIGGGDHHDLEVGDQILLTLIWLRLYPKQQVLADFFGISQPSVWRYLQRLVPLLEQSGHDLPCSPDPGRKRRRELGALLVEIPELVTVIGEAVRFAGRNASSTS